MNGSVSASAAKIETFSWLSTVQLSVVMVLLVFTPVARGATTRWAFCIALWLALIAALVMVGRRLWQEQRIFPRTPLDVPLAAVIVLAAASWIGSIYRDATFWALLRLCLYVLVFYLVFDLTASRRQIRRLVLALVTLGAAVAFLGLVKYSGAPILSIWRDAGTATRLNSTFINPDHLAGYLAMLFCLGLGVFVQRSGQTAPLWVIALLLMLVAIGLSLSRGGWIATFAGVEFMILTVLWDRRASKVKIVVIAVVLLLAAGLTLMASNPILERASTLQTVGDHPDLNTRVMAWKATLRLIEESPVLGKGLGTFPWSFTRVRPAGLMGRFYEAHNDYLQIAAGAGLPILAVLLWGLVVVYRIGLRTVTRVRSRFYAGVCLGALSGISAILVHSLVDFNLQITCNGIIFSCLGGLLLGVAEKTGKNGRWGLAGDKN